MKIVPIKEEDRKRFIFPLDSMTVDGQPIRNFVANKDAEAIVFTTVAEWYPEAEPESNLIDHVLIVPDNAWTNERNREKSWQKHLVR